MKTLYVDAGVTDNGNRKGNQFARICVHTGKDLLVDEPLGNRTVNEAEILAILKAVELLDGEPGLIYSDSQIAVNLLNRRWRAHKPHLQALLKPIPSNVKVQWIRRNVNEAGMYLEFVYGF